MTVDKGDRLGRTSRRQDKEGKVLRENLSLKLFLLFLILES